MDATAEPVEENSTSGLEENQFKMCLPKSCPLCSVGFDKIAPKLLPCLHSFCQPCLEVKMTEQREQNTSTNSSNTSRLKCPNCGQEFLVPSRGISSLIDNQFILENLVNSSDGNEADGHVCTSCDDNSSSTSYCINCTEWLCDACVQAHQRVRVTKDHEIKSKEEFANTLKNKGRTERALFCQKHPCEKLTLFCANCERLTCRDCQLHEHKEHKYQFVSEAASRYRGYFKKRLENLGEKMPPLTESIEAVQNSTQHLDHKAEVIANEIKTSTLQMLKAVKQRELVLLNELKALVHFKRKMLTKQSKDLSLMQDILNHNFEFTKYAVNEGSDVSLLFSKRQLGSRLQNLLSLKYKVLPVAQSDLKFTAETMKIVNTVLKAGTVVTPTGAAQMSHRSNIPQGNSGNQHMSPSQVTNTMFNAKRNPMHSLNTFTHRLGGVFSAGMKPSSKVYPNVVTSQMASNNMPYFNSNKRIAQQLIVPNVTAGTSVQNSATGLPSGYRNSPMGSSSTTVRKSSHDGSGIPLHHMIDSNQKSRPTGLLTTMRRTSSTSPNMQASAAETVHNIVQNLRKEQAFQNNHKTSSPSTSQGAARDKTPPSSTTNDHTTKKSSSGLSNTDSLPTSKTFGINPDIAASYGQNSKAPSPNITIPSPKTSQSSISPQSTPKLSPGLSLPTNTPSPNSSPLPSPLPTFLDPVMQNAFAGNLKIKVEKESPPPPAISPPYSMVKKESDRYPCSFHSVDRETFTGSPSNNSSNDDWCAVCRNGGELLCCDTCPKVFHLTCHVPTLANTPSDNWSCGLCESIDNISGKSLDLTSGHKRRGPTRGMSDHDTKICEKLLLELFCHPDSFPFHQKVSKSVPNYYKTIQKPMDLTSMKTKLQRSHFEHYNVIDEFISDCELIFANCAMFNDAGSEVGKMGKRLSRDFEGILRKYLPHHQIQEGEPRAKRIRNDF